MTQYDTVVSAIDGLKKRGFTLDFNIAFDQIKCLQNDRCLQPSEFEITEAYRFEGDTNPSDEDVVYGVESNDGTLKGIITTAYGMYADSASTEMISKLKMHTH